MADPEFFKDKEQAAQAATDYKEHAATIERCYTEWSEISDEIEKLEADFDAKIS